MPATAIRLQRKCGCGGSGEACAECANNEPELQRHEANHEEPNTNVPSIVDEVLSSAGQPLDDDTRTFMETRFQADFTGVRIHTDARAAESARAVNALAYTVNQHVAFGAGQYAPELNEGRQLIAHELAHVVQQTGAGASGKRLARKPGTFATAKQMVLEELNRRMPAAILVMLDGLDRETREMLAVDPDFTNAVARLPAASRSLVYKHLAATDQGNAERKARVVLEYIKTEARARAATPKVVKTDTMFYKRLTDFYLKDYLADPSQQRGKEAIAKIGQPFTGTPNAKDLWERAAATIFSKQPIPKMFQLLRPKLPENIAAGTGILSLENRQHLPYVDVDPLLGKPNVSTKGLDADIKGGKNISHLLHWATGVKYSDPSLKLDERTLRELFLAYELWHLEAWDVFGEDPLNDLIVEEAGRIMGTQLGEGAINKANLQEKLNEGFAQARAWVGSLLCIRQEELDAWILAEKQKPANVWWGTEKPVDVWGPATIYSRLAAGDSVEDVKAWEFTQRVIDIYALIYEAELWKKARKPAIANTALTGKLAEGALNKPIEKVTKGENVSLGELLSDLGLLNMRALFGSGDAPDKSCD